MKKEQLAEVIVREHYKEMPVFHEFKEQGYCEAAARRKTEQYYVRNFSKKELQDMYENYQ